MSAALNIAAVLFGRIRRRRRGTGGPYFLLAEDWDNLLLESGDAFLLEG